MVLFDGLNVRGAPDESLELGFALMRELGCKVPACQIPYIFSGVHLINSVARHGLAQKLKSLPILSDPRKL